MHLCVMNQCGFRGPKHYMLIAVLAPVVRACSGPACCAVIMLSGKQCHQARGPFQTLYTGARVRQNARTACAMGGDFASVHIVGIGGMGMAPLAVLALRDGMLVSGSDMQAGKNTRMLEDLGITVHIGHSPLNVPQASRPSQCVLATTAAKDTNAEIQRAR